MKIIITNCQIFNGGDAAILLGIVNSLRHEFGASVQITVLDPDADVARKYYPSWRVVQMPFYTFNRLLRKIPLNRFTIWLNRIRYQRLPFLLTAAERYAFDVYREADCVISTGGTYLVEQYNLKPRLFELFLSQYAAKPLIFYTQSMGPFRKPAYQYALRHLFDAAALIMVRDDRSRRNLLEIGIANEKIRTLADAAFGLATGKILQSAAASSKAIRRVAISVRHWDHFKGRSRDEGMRTYKEAVSRAVIWLVKTLGIEVTFISTCQGIPEYWAKDSEVAKDIINKLPEDVAPFVHVDQAFHQTAQLMEKVRGFDMVIATRMHMGILALASGVPVLPISYEFKTDELFKTLGMGAWVLDINRLSESSIEEALARFVVELPKFRAELFSSVRGQMDSSLEGGGLVRVGLGL